MGGGDGANICRIAQSRANGEHALYIGCPGAGDNVILFAFKIIEVEMAMAVDKHVDWSFLWSPPRRSLASPRAYARPKAGPIRRDSNGYGANPLSGCGGYRVGPVCRV